MTYCIGGCGGNGENGEYGENGKYGGNSWNGGTGGLGENGGNGGNSGNDWWDWWDWWVALMLKCGAHTYESFRIDVSIVIINVLCIKGCISRSEVKSSGVWEMTQHITAGLPPRVTLDGVFQNTSIN